MLEVRSEAGYQSGAGIDCARAEHGPSGSYGDSSIKELITFLHTIDGDLRRLLDSVGSVSYRGTVTVA